MGGHGGLNILPQKKWNVYNYDNRDIVQADKKKHSLKLRRDYETLRATALDNKLSVLKEEQGDDGRKASDPLVEAVRAQLDSGRQTNLFAAEEEFLKRNQPEEIKRLKELEFLKGKNMDEASRFVGSFLKQVPWYSKPKHTNKCQEPIKEQLIEVVKSDSLITKELNRVEISKWEEGPEIYDRYDPKRRQRTRDKPKKSLNTMELLREKRLEREKKEARREAQLKKMPI